MIRDFTNVYLVRLRFTFTFCKKKKTDWPSSELDYGDEKIWLHFLEKQVNEATVTKMRTLACESLHFLQNQKPIIEVKPSLIQLFSSAYQSLVQSSKTWIRERTKITETERLASLYILEDKRWPVLFTSFLVIFLYTNLMYTKYSTRKQTKTKQKYSLFTFQYKLLLY